MTIKNIFLMFRKNEDNREIRRKLASLEMNMEMLKQSLEAIQKQSPKDEVKKDKDPPIIIEKINIEKIILDKYELNNNFGQLGIKELKGKLNIGATYGSEFTPNLEEEKTESSEKEPYQREEKKPKINIQSKKEDG
ncbi:hypothetical protein HPT25_24170 [Bacillus sp. BRMEA1]|uniref:hypothetical protein n=1 Tax=Neobacillus endophyticus TaxID=2738405 RepID=UPI001564CA91|nr:hypothetical protein [Neobacillus endophyticus]NRD80422.1 hypothetical protein [Neobacillus endophyticus]